MSVRPPFFHNGPIIDMPNNRYSQYANLLSFQKEYDSVLAGGSSAGNVSGMWLTILTHYFPVAENFAHRPEEYKADMGGYTDITSVKWIPAPTAERAECRPFLVTQTKSRRYETGTVEWETGRNQLIGYLGATPIRQRRKYYWGIVAVGKFVEFYQYEIARDTMQQVGQRLNVATDAREVQNILLDIKRRTR
ncbi:hypothetical protein ASPBRDRAFT_30965 [Aspergillus brasiliensis CBS 101740]|uniref:Uncharacterized protein n=1 Tax=Aspergillus brasiliensis (strain CBS 101740 / IMI 381727 / IBT 21946) TaxID=767769 RepID=A0A1L9UI25_ASPBC|nr:hypothetical protein ASPBRDRAFT_30965 [Aspergillus brasiliensis CBS 101740]